MLIPKVQPFSFWRNEVENRNFLVVDIPATELQPVMLMEIKPYQPAEERHFIKLPYIDWVVLTEEQNKLIPFTPKA